METKEKNRITFRELWALCPGRHVVLLVSLAWLVFYFALRSHRGLMNFLCRVLVRPWHKAAGSVFSLVPFSLAEWCILLMVLAGLAFFVQLLIHAIGRRGKAALARWAVTLAGTAACLFGLFCLWWGVFYYSDSFAEQSGIEVRGVTVSELKEVTAYFADAANEYAPLVQRDEYGVYTADEKSLFDRSRTLYHPAEETFPCLRGPELRAKPAVFSRFMSRINYTGYFFPYTAEANLNVDSPICFLPSTIAHELAHQRGVAGEDEANFVGIFACMESGDPDFIYSGALLAYTYLGNALHSASYADWEEIAATLSDEVWNDLIFNNAYWQQFFETTASEVSEKVYEGFLRTYGDDRGMQSYGACVDLLVAWYGRERMIP